MMRPLLFLLITACGGASFNGSRDEAFLTSVEARADEDWEDAAVGALVYLSTATEDDDRYDRAQMLLAEALRELGFRYGAALYYWDVAQARRNAELANEAVLGLRSLATSGQIDQDLLLRSFVASSDIGSVGPELRDFVLYERGVDNLRRGESEWAMDALNAIDRESEYFARAEIARAAVEIDDGQLQRARQRLEALIADDNDAPVPNDVSVEARLALARIALDQERYRAAIRIYETLQDVAAQRPSLLLEMAWAHYYQGNYRRSLGLLVALDAPVYQGLIAPERYLLEAYNLRRLCQFDPARTAASRLRAQHGEVLRDLRDGIPPVESEWLRAAALQRDSVLDLARLARATREEVARLEDLSDRAEEASSRLRNAYAWALRRVERRLENDVDAESRTIASELISADDGVRLILHELSVQLLRGRSRPTGPPPSDTIGDVPSGRVAYAFGGEFWTDELDEFEVVIEDRCLQ